ncbi:MAG: hypothetical protein KH354_07320 [Clostridiales bacterium]|nr:hypothetical protein [Clostridiales bacterium]
MSENTNPDKPRLIREEFETYEDLPDDVLQQLEEDGAGILINRSERLITEAQELSSFIRALPLSVEDNDKLVAMFTAQIVEAEKSAFTQGFKMGMDYLPF